MKKFFATLLTVLLVIGQLVTANAAWVQSADKWYYFDASGRLLTNTTTPDGYVVGADGAWIPSLTTTSSGWQQDSKGWWWRRADGSYPVSTWEWLDGNNDGVSESYYFRADGYMVANTTVGGYTVNANGAWTVNGVVQTRTATTSTTTSSLPQYTGSPYVAINNNVPAFTSAELERARTLFEEYSPLDSLSRVTLAVASVSDESMPTTERGSISNIKPTGWQTIKYDVVEGKYLYNRCHLIGYQLTGTNSVKSGVSGKSLNLITGTRYLNVEGMLPFENLVADYIESTRNNILIRVTPHYDGNNLLASGVQIEAQSIEDNGAGIKFNVYCFNVQPGIIINYADGSSYLAN